MCEPSTLLAVASVMKGYQAKQQGNYENKIAQYNAAVLDNDAIKARNIGTEKENDQRQAVAQLLAQQKAALGASGVVIDTGSAGQLLQETNQLGEVDALRIRRNVDDTVQSLETQSELKIAEGKAARSAGNTKFVTSLMMAAGTVASKWYTPDSAAQQAVQYDSGATGFTLDPSQNIRPTAIPLG